MVQLRSPLIALRPDARFAAELRARIEESWLGVRQSSLRAQVLGALRTGDDDALLDALDNGARRDLGGAPQQLRGLVGQILGRSLDLGRHPLVCLLLASTARSASPPYPAWEGLLKLAMDQLDKEPDPQAQGFLAFVQGQIAFEAGNLKDAASCYGRCRHFLGKDSPLNAFAAALEAMGAYWRGDLRGALDLGVEAVAQAHQHHDGVAGPLANLVVAFCHLNFGQFKLASRYLGDSVRMYSMLSGPVERQHFPLAHAGLGVMHALRGHKGEAFEAFREGIRVAEENEDGTYRAAVMAAMAEFTVEFDCEAAAHAAQEAFDYLEAHDERWWITWAQRALGVASLHRRDYQMAMLQLEHLTELELSPLEMARTNLYLGEAASSVDPDRARAALRAAAASFGRTGSKLLRARAMLALASLEGDGGGKPEREEAVGIIRAQTDPAYGRLLPRVRVRLLGAAQIFIGEKECRFRTLFAKKLTVALLLADTNWLSRDVLGTMLWPQLAREQQLRSVNGTIHLARQALGSERWRLETHDEGMVSFDRRWVAVDYLDLSAEAKAIRRLSGPVGADTCRRAKELRGLLDVRLLSQRWAGEEWVEKEDAERKRRVEDLDAFIKAHCR